MTATELTFEETSELTGIPARRLRYVFDRDILPKAITHLMRYLPASRRGVARRFNRYFAFLLCLAELLRQSGLEADMIRLALDRLKDWVSAGRNLERLEWRLRPVCEYARDLDLEVGEGMYIRAARKADLPPCADRIMGIPNNPLPWTLISTGGIVAGQYKPLTLTKIDTGLLAEKLGMPAGPTER